MNVNMKVISFVIVTYHSQKDIINCIDSIYKTADIPIEKIEIIVVENGSKEAFEETKNLIKNRFSESVLMHHNSENGGYGQGNNIGVKLATAEIIAIVNPDVIFVRPIFAQALEIFKKNSSVAIIGGNQLGGDNMSFWIRPEFDFFIFTAPICRILNKLNIYIEKYFFLSGALLFIDKEKFEEIGGFDEKIFMYCEESDIINRLLKKKSSTLYKKDFIYKHLIDDRTETSDSNLLILLKSYKYYLEKHKFSYRSFLERRILSLKVMVFFYNLLNKKSVAVIKKRYLKIFENKLKDLKNEG